MPGLAAQTTIDAALASMKSAIRSPFPAEHAIRMLDCRKILHRELIENVPRYMIGRQGTVIITMLILAISCHGRRAAALAQCTRIKAAPARWQYEWADDDQSHDFTCHVAGHYI